MCMHSVQTFFRVHELESLVVIMKDELLLNKVMFPIGESSYESKKLLFISCPTLLSLVKLFVEKIQWDAHLD